MVSVLFARPDTNNTSWSSYLRKHRNDLWCSTRFRIRPVTVFIVNKWYLCSKTLNLCLFADDTRILYADKTLKSLEHTVNAELNKLYVWLTSNKLNLNIKKSNFVIFRPYHKRLSFQPKISIFDNNKNINESLDCKGYVKNPGILIDYNLSWKNHIEYIALKINKAVDLIAKLRHFVPLHTLLSVFNFALDHLRIICLGSVLILIL